MADGLYEYRLTMIVPMDKIGTIVSSLTGILGPGAVPQQLGPMLSPTGAAPPTHRWCCGAYTDEETLAVLTAFADLAGVIPPPAEDWAGWSFAEKEAWVQTLNDALVAATGIAVYLADNRGAWHDPASLLTDNGLQVMTPEAEARTPPARGRRP